MPVDVALACDCDHELKLVFVPVCWYEIELLNELENPTDELLPPDEVSFAF